MKKRSSQLGFTLVELLVVIAIIGMLVSILLPAVQAARASARRSQCQSNIRQVALAALNFESAKGYLPSSIRPAGLTPLPRIAGITLLLPYLEQGNRYDIYDQTKNWNDPVNLAAVNQRIGVLECPSTPRPERFDGLPEASPWVGGIGAPTDYSATIYVDQRLESAGLVDKAGSGMLERNGTPTLGAVTDGVSNTIMFAESAGRPYLYRNGRLVSEDLTQVRVNGGGWCRPATEISIDGSSRDGLTFPGPCAINCTNGEDVGTSGFPHPYYGSFGTGEPYSFHTGGAHFAFGDASVHFLNDAMDIREFARFVTRGGREVTPTTF
jgi:prepilin-type N-terminal cleavage/methylation domain-containing protein